MNHKGTKLGRRDWGTRGPLWGLGAMGAEDWEKILPITHSQTPFSPAWNL